MSKALMLGAGTRKILKGIHILSAACVEGGLFAVIVLLLVKNASPGIDAFPVDLSILKVFTWCVNYAFILLLFTSFIFGLFTEWGFVRHYWIIFKWIAVAGLFVLTWVGLGPAINGMTAVSDAGFHLTTLNEQYIQFVQKALIFSFIEFISLAIIFIFSVVKPWGKRNIKRQTNQKTAVTVLLPVIVVGITFAAFNAATLNKARQMPITDSNLSRIEDGIYEGESTVGNYVYKVKVEVTNHKIMKIQSLDNRKSPYVTYAEGVFSKIIEKQTANVDAVTGATTTSKAFMKAVENALASDPQ